MLLTLSVGIGSEISSCFAIITQAFSQKAMFPEQDIPREQNASLLIWMFHISDNFSEIYLLLHFNDLFLYEY